METIITNKHEGLLGMELLKRKTEIEDKIKDSDRTIDIEFQGKYICIPVIEVRIEFPIYRLANGRTRTFQREYIVTHSDAPSDLFSRDQESVDAQFAQHEILLRLAEEEELLKTFKGENLAQTEPLICTNDGVVVNGNRRLCAWRELYYENRDRFKQFQMIRIAVLPSCDEEAIEELESKLQIQNTMRAEYHWHTIALMAKEKIEQDGKKVSEVAKAFGRTSSDLKKLMDARDYAEQYLIQIEKPEQWSLVDKEYHAFDEMAKGRKKLTAVGDKELFDAIAFKIITEGSESGRLYDLIPGIAEYLPSIASGIDEVIPTNADNEQGNLLDEESSEAMDLLAGDDSIEVDENSILAKRVRECDDGISIQNTVSDIIETQKQLKQERNSKNYLLNQLSRVVSYLQNAIDSDIFNEDINTNGVESQLDSIDEKVATLRRLLIERNENNN